MQVVGLDPVGALSQHNQLQPDAALQEGDVVLSVNGVHGDFDAMGAQLAKDSVVFEVERREAQVHTLQTLGVNDTPGKIISLLCHIIMNSQSESACSRLTLGQRR